MAAAEPLEEPHPGAPRGTQPSVPDEPARVQGLSPQGKPGAIVEVHVPRSHDQLPAEVDGSTAVAATEAVRGTRYHPIEPPGRHRQLLPDQRADDHQPWARLQEPALPAAQGQAPGGQQPRTYRRV